ncbi:MAG: hypothetical protein KJ666_02820 [Bacteroidetes bacterium]|nr:hypothetical protein [Bacteroidota bacterium]
MFLPFSRSDTFGARSIDNFGCTPVTETLCLSIFTASFSISARLTSRSGGAAA